MARFEFEVTRRIEVVTTIVIRAKDEEEATAKLGQKIENGLCDDIEVRYPNGWDVADEETDYELMS